MQESGEARSGLAQQGWRVIDDRAGCYILGYRLQSARKRQEGASHPGNAQFEHINAAAFFPRGA